MKRIIYIDGKLDKEKYVLKEEYNNFGLYQGITPTGWKVHQEWAVTDGNVTLVVYSFNNICYEEMLDMIDNYVETGKFGIKGFKRNVLVAHPSGDKNL